MKKEIKPKNVGEYIKSAPKEARAGLKELRRVIKASAPTAEEKISYGMPYYHYYGRLIYFAYFKDHLSLFVMSSAIKKKYAKELKPYHKTKATLHFKYGEKLPLAHVKKIVKEQAKENAQRYAKKTGKKVCSRGHVFSPPGPCPVCWPGRKKK